MSGSFAAWSRTFFQKFVFFLKKPLVQGSCAARGRTVIQKSDVCFEEATCLGQLRCQRQIFVQTSDCFKNLTWTISKHALSESLGARFAEQNVGNRKNMHFQEFWDACAQNNTSEISQNALSRILGLLCAEQDVGTLKQCIFRNYGTPARRTTRRTSQTT